MRILLVLGLMSTVVIFQNCSNLESGYSVNQFNINSDVDSESVLTSSSYVPVNLDQAINLSVFLQEEYNNITNGQFGEVTIPAGVTIVLDQDISANRIFIEGKLVCPLNRNLKIETESILIESGGVFECGSLEGRFLGNLEILLKRKTQDDIDMRTKGIMVGDEGVLALHGRRMIASWLEINQSINPGQKVVRVKKDERWQQNSGWRVGDEIVVASSSFDPHEAEKRTIVSVTENSNLIVLTVNVPFEYFHFGEFKTYVGAQKNWVINARAEIANLSRNILIKGEADDENGFGGHSMVHEGGSAYIDSVEFFQMGQQGIKARYPFHWHVAGDVTGQYVRFSSIHKSYQRCITVHGTQASTLQRNVCYDFFGHGYFLEDGDEEDNILRENLAILGKRVPQDRSVLETDHEASQPRRYSSPASFWVSNPNNTLIGNVSAGSEGSGFWYALKHRFCREGFCLEPSKTPFGLFRNNKAHSSEVGFTIDGGPNTNARSYVSVADDDFSGSGPTEYEPQDGTIPKFSNFMAYRNAHTGFWARGSKMIVKDSIFLENMRSVVFANNQVLKDSVIIGQLKGRNDFSEDLSRTFLRYQPDSRMLYEFNTSIDQPFVYGIDLYDGPGTFENIDFLDFPTDPYLVDGEEIIFTAFQAFGGVFKSTTNYVSGLFFGDNTPYRKVHFGVPNRDAAYGGEWVTGIYDSDGSLTGTEGANVISAVEEINFDNSCSLDSVWKAYICTKRFAQILVKRNNAVDFYKLKIRNHRGVWFNENTRFTSNKFSYLLRDKDEYNHLNGVGSQAYTFLPDVDDNMCMTRLILTDAQSNDEFALIRIRDPLNDYLAIKNHQGGSLPKRMGLAGLLNSGVSAWTRSNNHLYVKIVANSLEQSVLNESFPYTGSVLIKKNKHCN